MIFPDDASRWVARDVFLLGRHRPERWGIDPISILDLGCHGGYTTLDFALCYPDARVYGVEMDESMAQVANANVSGLARIHNCAVWHKNTIVYYEPLGSSNLRRAVSHLPAGIPVEAQTIDTIMDRLGLDTVEYMKMDIEGAEYEVLRDYSWHDRVGSLYCELHDMEIQKTRDLFQFMRDHGWEIGLREDDDQLVAYH